jgi:hypothetical protein
MSLRTDRKQTHDAIAEGRFVAMTLAKSGTELDTDIKRRMSGFNSAFWSQRNFSVQNNTLVYTQKKVHRFVDMKTRLKNGAINNKKSHAIHNKPIFGNLNNIIRELSFGFSDALKYELKQLNNQNI